MTATDQPVNPLKSTTFPFPGLAKIDFFGRIKKVSVTKNVLNVDVDAIAIAFDLCVLQSTAVAGSAFTLAVTPRLSTTTTTVNPSRRESCFMFMPATFQTPYRHLSLKVHNVKFFSTLGFQHYCIYHCIIVKNLTLNTHCHAMISTHFKFSILRRIL